MSPWFEQLYDRIWSTDKKFNTDSRIKKQKWAEDFVLHNTGKVVHWHVHIGENVIEL